MEKWLYHATFRTNLKSIKELGLGAKQRKNWEISRDNVVCFASEPDIANDFCECAEDVSDFVFNSGVIVLAVKSLDLDPKLLSRDRNILDELTCYEYKGIIPSNKLYVISDAKGLVGKLLELKRVPSFYKN